MPAPPLTVQMVIRNHETTIHYALESLMPLAAHILVADIGSRDETPTICRMYGAEVIRLSLNDDMAQVRNLLLQKSQSKWNFYLEPWESILTGGECITAALHCQPTAYKVNILQGDVLTKPIRLWHKDTGLSFQYPVFETLAGPALESGLYLATAPNDDAEFKLDMIEKWRQRAPLANEPNYYAACVHLARKNWPTFINLADLYLHQERGEPMSAFMLRYYSAMVHCYIMKNHRKALGLLLPCLIKKPLMAEFWCLLADIYYDIADYKRAKCFYENATILGSRRPHDDGWPMEISKYKNYPEKMAAGCEKITHALRVYAGPAVV